MDWYSMSAADAVGKLSSSVDRGLSSREAEKRLGQDGENILRGKKKKSIIAEFFEQFKDFTVIVLLIASGGTRRLRRPDNDIDNSYTQRRSRGHSAAARGAFARGA